MEDENYTTIENEDFVIRVRPFRNSDGMWNGEIDLAIVTQPGNDLDDEDYYQMMHFCKMMASTIPLMESNTELRELAHDYVINSLDKEYEVELESKPEVTDIGDNVVQINFGTKTKGSA